MRYKYWINTTICILRSTPSSYTIYIISTDNVTMPIEARKRCLGTSTFQMYKANHLKVTRRQVSPILMDECLDIQCVLLIAFKGIQLIQKHVMEKQS